MNFKSLIDFTLFICFSCIPGSQLIAQCNDISHKCVDNIEGLNINYKTKVDIQYGMAFTSQGSKDYYHGQTFKTLKNNTSVTVEYNNHLQLVKPGDYT